MIIKIIIIIMLEIDRLHEITFNDLEKVINDTISNKIFVRNNIKKMQYLTEEEQLTKIHELFFSKSSYILIKTINNIEWTPIKLYLTGYYFVNLYNAFWLVSHNTHEGFVVKYKISHHKYIDIVFQTFTKLSIEYLPESYRCSKQEMSFAMQYLKENNVLIKQMSFFNSNVLLNHYIYKKDDCLYYFQFSNERVYKPIPLVFMKS
jgi:hypothetical protein